LDKHLFYAQVEPEVSGSKCETLTFYAMTDNGNGGQSLSGLFQYLACITRSEALAKGSSKKAEMASATAALSSGAYSEALQHLSTALVYGMDPKALLLRAEVHLKMKAYLKAAEDCQMVMGTAKGLVKAWKLLTEIQFKQGHYKACLQTCLNAPAKADLSQWRGEAEAKIKADQVEKDRYKGADDRAVSCPETDDVVGSVSSLASYLTEPFERDLLKHRVLFKWITEHISYNGEGFRTGEYGDLSPDGVLKSRMGVCSGYSTLYKALADKAGIEAIECQGYCKGFGHEPGKVLTQ